MADLESLFNRLRELQSETSFVSFAFHYRDKDELWLFRLANGREFAGKILLFTLDSVIDYILKNRKINESKSSKNKKPYTLLGV